VTITGIVTDQPIANAELEINVGSDVFSVNADQTGRYTIELVDRKCINSDNYRDSNGSANC